MWQNRDTVLYAKIPRPMPVASSGTLASNQFTRKHTVGASVVQHLRHHLSNTSRQGFKRLS